MHSKALPVAVAACFTLMTACGSDNGNATSSSSSSSSSSHENPCEGTYLLCDDFNGSTIDLSKWQAGHTNIANRYPVRPENVELTTVKDNGRTLNVVSMAIYGDRHSGPKRQGGVLISNAAYGSGRYEVRMKPLPGPHGCSCIWNYYDSDNENTPPPLRIYTEIDIEMPANLKKPPVWSEWKRTLGLNTWSRTDSDDDATYINHRSNEIDPFDGQFHVFRWDWRADGDTLQIDWYVDNIKQASTTEHVSDHPAQLWVGNWPAPWAGMDYDFDTHHLYIDWVRISALP